MSIGDLPPVPPSGPLGTPPPPSDPLGSPLGGAARKDRELDEVYRLLKDPTVPPGRYGVLGEPHWSKPYGRHHDAWDIVKDVRGKLTPKDKALGNMQHVPEE